MPMASPAILSSFLGQQGTQNHPQYFSGLSRALFPTTFLEIADKNKQTNKTKTKKRRQSLSPIHFSFEGTGAAVQTAFRHKGQWERANDWTK